MDSKRFDLRSWMNTLPEKPIENILLEINLRSMAYYHVYTMATIVFIQFKYKFNGASFR